MESNLHSRAVRAGVRFLQKRDHEIIDKLVSENIDIISEDENGIHMIKVTVSTDEMPSVDVTPFRENFEREAINAIANHPEYVGSTICFDVMDMVTLFNDTAFLRYHTNCLS